MAAGGSAIRPGDVMRAIARGEIRLVYQPKISLPTGHMVGVEALARWQSPKRGSVPPDLFVATAERNSVIDALTEYLLGVALDQWGAWRAQGLAAEIAFNISAKNLHNVDFPDVVDRACHDRGIATKNLTVELTESATQQAVQLMDTLTRLRIKGIRISLDDFGIGYSSLSQLKQLPFTEIKIDKSFVMEAHRSRDSRVIIKSIVDLAHNLDLEVTAEGVETRDALGYLVDLGCDKAQGYYIARPMAGDALPQWAQAWKAKIDAAGLLPFAAGGQPRRKAPMANRAG
jgi:EAL domain-containing protein (putative c-di-GMP-specific phosphodiesterase class I)